MFSPKKSEVGMIESECESWTVNEKKVKVLFREKLNITEDIEIYRAHRVGRWDKNKPRTIILRCHRYKQKEEMEVEGDGSLDM